MFLSHTIYQLLRGDPFLFRAQHYGCAMRIIGTHVVYLVLLHFLEAHPDVGLDIFHQVPKVNTAVRVGKCGSNENFSLVHQ